MTDRYTKAVLTVIALALSTLALQNAGLLRAQAQEQPAGDGIAKVQLCGTAPDGAVRCANLAQNAEGWIGLYTFSALTR